MSFPNSKEYLMFVLAGRNLTCSEAFHYRGSNRYPESLFDGSGPTVVHGTLSYESKAAINVEEKWKIRKIQ